MISALHRSRPVRPARGLPRTPHARAVRVAGASVAAWCVGSAVLLAPAAAAAPNTDPYVPPSETVAGPVTDTCPQRDTPPPAADTSEDVPPGVAPPTPLPVPALPVGGGRLGECGLIVPDGGPPLPPDISAGAWVVADLTTGEVLAAKDPHGRYRPASTLKLLTAQVMLRNLTNLDQVVAGTENDAGQEGTRVGIEAGGQYTVRQLITYLVIISGNDAANALARTNGGYEKTVADMNAAAQAMGALDTRAVTPSGLDGPGQTTSAYDLALFAQGAMATPNFPEIVSSVDVRVPAAAGEGYIAANDNQLLFQYPGALGGKTGFTDDAGNTFVGMAERDGRRLVVAMMNGTQQPRRQWMQAASLLDWGFALPPGTTPVGRMVTSLAEATAAPLAPTPTTGPPSPSPEASAADSASGAASDTTGGSDDVVTVTSTVQDGGAPRTAATSANVAATGSSGGVPTGALVAGIVVLAGAVVAALLLIVRRRRRPAFAGDARPAPDTAVAAGVAAGATDASVTPPSPPTPADRTPEAAPHDAPPLDDGGRHAAPESSETADRPTEPAEPATTHDAPPPAEPASSGESPADFDTGPSSESGSGDSGSGDSGSSGGDSGGGDSGGCG